MLSIIVADKINNVGGYIIGQNANGTWWLH